MQFVDLFHDKDSSQSVTATPTPPALAADLVIPTPTMISSCRLEWTQLVIVSRQDHRRQPVMIITTTV
jgi:hypothetical protein